MKKTYSVILLFAYVVGTIQPVMPMFKYELRRGDVIEYVLSKIVSANTIASVSAVGSREDSTKTPGKILNLLRDSFYPVGVSIFTAHNPVPYANKKAIHLAVNIKTKDPTYFPNSPPPRIG